MFDDPKEQLLKLKNLGPKSVAQLVEIGILSKEQLCKLGTEEVFRRLYFRFSDEHRLSANFLYALEGAIQDCDWRWVTGERRTQLKSFLKHLKS